MVLLWFVHRKLDYGCMRSATFYKGDGNPCKRFHCFLTLRQMFLLPRFNPVGFDREAQCLAKCLFH